VAAPPAAATANAAESASTEVEPQVAKESSLVDDLKPTETVAVAPTPIAV
jgi:hypothetical protein